MIAGTTKLYAYAGDWRTSGPHDVILDLSDEDVRRYDEVKEREFPSLGRFDVGSFVEVTDQATGKRWKVATAPCGQPCHCAAVAEEVAER